MGFDVVPTEPTTTIWEGELVPRVDLEPDRAKGGSGRRVFEPEDLGDNPPVVTIGRPEVLRALTSVEAPGFEAITPTDFYLVRLWCSFHTFGTDVRFEHARFTVSLSSPGDGESIVARDMHPTEVVYKVERDVNVSLSPEVKFQEVSAKLGSVSYGFSYTELQPVMVAAGQGEPEPSWTLSSTKSRSLEGGKAMHLLLAAPMGTTVGEAELDVVAHVSKPGLIALPMGLFDKHGALPTKSLKVRLW